MFGWQPAGRRREGEATEEAAENDEAGWEIHGVTFRLSAGTR
jgi:hypothetical protein